VECELRECTGVAEPCAVERGSGSGELSNGAVLESAHGSGPNRQESEQATAAVRECRPRHTHRGPASFLHSTPRFAFSSAPTSRTSPGRRSQGRRPKSRLLPAAAAEVRPLPSLMWLDWGSIVDLRDWARLGDGCLHIVAPGRGPWVHRSAEPERRLHLGFGRAPRQPWAPALPSQIQAWRTCRTTRGCPGSGTRPPPRRMRCGGAPLRWKESRQRGGTDRPMRLPCPVRRAPACPRARAPACSQIRIMAAGKPRAYCASGLELLREKGHRTVLIKAMGRAINKAVTVGAWPGRARALRVRGDVKGPIRVAHGRTRAHTLPHGMAAATQPTQPATHRPLLHPPTQPRCSSAACSGCTRSPRSGPWSSWTPG
jgi:hypothetical protein